MGLWVLAGTWSAGEELDGVVPDYVIDELASTAAIAGQLVLAGLWDVYEGPSTIPNGRSTIPDRCSTIPALSGWRFRNWSKYQPTRAQLEENREKERIRKANYRLSHGDAARTPAGVTVGHQRVSGHPDPTRPDPTYIEPTDGSANAEPDKVRMDVEAICERLAGAIEGNGIKKPNVTKAWRDAARLLIDKDGYTVPQIEWMIEWCQNDEFWRSNILSMPKLRAKFSQLKLKAVPGAAAKPKVDPNWALR